MIIREATIDDYREFYGVEPRRTVFALCAETSTGLKGFGGYYYANGQAVAFTDHIGELTRREVVQCGRAMSEFLGKVSTPIIAAEGEYGTTTLEHFGFERAGDYWRK